MTLEEWQNSLASACQSDLENGARWLNERAAEEFQAKYPALNAWIGEFMRATDPTTEGREP